MVTYTVSMVYVQISIYIIMQYTVHETSERLLRCVRITKCMHACCMFTICMHVLREHVTRMHAFRDSYAKKYNLLN